MSRSISGSLLCNFLCPLFAQTLHLAVNQLNMSEPGLVGAICDTLALPRMHSGVARHESVGPSTAASMSRPTSFSGAEFPKTPTVAHRHSFGSVAPVPPGSCWVGSVAHGSTPFPPVRVMGACWEHVPLPFVHAILHSGPRALDAPPPPHTHTTRTHPHAHTLPSLLHVLHACVITPCVRSVVVSHVRSALCQPF